MPAITICIITTSNSYCDYWFVTTYGAKISNPNNNTFTIADLPFIFIFQIT